MPIGALIGAAGAVGGALITGSAAKSAAKTQAGAADKAAEVQLQMFNTAQEGLKPFREFGTSALSPYAELLGFGPKGSAGAQSALENIPGYQFQRDQGVKQVNNSLGGRGVTGAQAKGIARFVTGLADSTYGEQVGRYQNAATIGANAAAGQATNALQTGQNVGNAYQSAGQATAAGQVGAANAAAQGLYGLSNLYLTSKLLGGGGGGGGGGSGGVPAGGWSGG